MFRLHIISCFYSFLKEDLARHISILMVILYQLNLCQLFYKLLKQPNYFGRFWQFMRRTRQSLMVHEGAKLNNFNAVCLIIVAHEGAKFNEPGDGLTNQLCRRHSAFVRGENLRGLKTLPLSIFQSIVPYSCCPICKILNHSERNLR